MSDTDDSSVHDASADMDRRDLLIAGSAVTAAGLLSAPDAEAAKKKPPEKMAAQPGDRIQLIKGPNKGELLRPDHLLANKRPIEAFPFDSENEVLRRKNRLNRLLVLKLDPSEMNEDTRARTDDSGVLVYSAICTHRGCTIKSWLEDVRELRCHCHLSRFAALEEGRVMNGPAKRQLPMVPIRVDEEGFVLATDGFIGKVGAAKK